MKSKISLAYDNKVDLEGKKFASFGKLIVMQLSLCEYFGFSY